MLIKQNGGMSRRFVLPVLSPAMSYVMFILKAIAKDKDKYNYKINIIINI